MEKDDFEQVYSQYYKVVYAYLLTLCHSEELAADLAQETFYKALRGIDRFQQECPLNVWLCSNAKHALVDHYRRHRKEAQPEQMPDLPDEAMAQITEILKRKHPLVAGMRQEELYCWKQADASVGSVGNICTGACENASSAARDAASHPLAGMSRAERCLRRSSRTTPGWTRR